MYKHTLILMAIAISFSSILHAQTTTESTTDTLKMAHGKITVIINDSAGGRKAKSLSLTSKRDKKRDVFETFWGSFDLGFNNYKDENHYTDYTFALPSNLDRNYYFVNTNGANINKSDFNLRSGKSVNINFGIVKAHLSLYKHYINLVSGITYDINNWSYQSNINWNKKPEIQNAIFNQEEFISRNSVSFKKNKLVTNYLQVPLLLRFETNPTHEKRNLCISVGGYAGYLMRVHTKQVETGSSEKIKQHDDFNITKFQYGLQAEIGYQGISLYFKRSLTPLTQFGTIQYPYSFGIRLSGL